MTITAKVIADSISPAGKRITTLQLCYPRFIHAEFMTHRVFGRNASSSRAIPVMKMLAQVWNDPAMPIHWGANQAGMQAKQELSGMKRTIARWLWKGAGKVMCGAAYAMTKLGLHKQVANRILEPWQHIHVVVTATEWSNWRELRKHDDAQPEIHELAIQIDAAMDASTPKLLLTGEWHLPYITVEDRNNAFFLAGGEGSEKYFELLRKVSAARCCRVSYLRHDGHPTTIDEDLALCDRLVGAEPLHASPFEHQATPVPEAQPRVYFNGQGDVEIKGDIPDGVSHIDMNGVAWSGNLSGWIQNRKIVEKQFK